MFNTKLNNKIRLQLLLCSIWLVLLAGCTKFVQVGAPDNQLTNQNVFSNDGSAVSAINGVFARMAEGNSFASGGSSSLSLLCGLSSDEFLNSSATTGYIEFANNTVSSTGMVGTTWGEMYQYVFSANSIIEGLANSKSLSDSIKSRVLGEAKFVRAFNYFYLVSLFGDVPLYTTTSYLTNSKSFRTKEADVYAQIEMDLKDAQNLLADDYSFSGTERIAPNKWVATALLARAYLYQQKWDSAENASSLVINESGLYTLTSLDSTFLKNSSEALWQLSPVDPNINSYDGNTFILDAPPTLVSISNFLLSSFETGDQRYSQWINSFSDGTNTWYFPFKYKIKANSSITEYTTIMRLAEQYLIRAEATAHIGTNLSAAETDLNTIRTRAGLFNTTANNMNSLLAAITHERQVELFSEWGHRWLDLIRTSQADAILGSEKPTYKPYSVLYPIPLSEIQNNNNITQNVGY